MKILVDMNLSPDLCGFLAERGFDSIHWSDVGDRTAPDREIMEWARANGYAVLTHDLDFGAALAATADAGPSVLQIRTHNVLADHIAPIVATVLKEHQAAIEAGALVVVSESRSRIRILPLRP